MPDYGGVRVCLQRFFDQLANTDTPLQFGNSSGLPLRQLHQGIATPLVKIVIFHQLVVQVAPTGRAGTN
jgi:hypothetical protein